MNIIEKQKKMDLLMKIGIIILIILAIVGAIAFFFATKEVGQAIFLNV